MVDVGACWPGTPRSTDPSVVRHLRRGGRRRRALVAAAAGARRAAAAARRARRADGRGCADDVPDDGRDARRACHRRRAGGLGRARGDLLRSTSRRSASRSSCCVAMRAVPPPPTPRASASSGDRRRPALRGQPARAAGHVRRRHAGHVLRHAVRRCFRRSRDGYGGAGVLGLLYSAIAAGALLASATSGWAAHVHRHGRAVVAGRRRPGARHGRVRLQRTRSGSRS